MIKTHEYTEKQLDWINKMEAKGWTHISYEEMLKLITEREDLLFTSKGSFLYYREDK